MFFASASQQSLDSLQSFLTDSSLHQPPLCEASRVRLVSPFGASRTRIYNLRLHIPSMAPIHVSILWNHHRICESDFAPHTFSSLCACDSRLIEKKSDLVIFNEHIRSFSPYYNVSVKGQHNKAVLRHFKFATLRTE